MDEGDGGGGLETKKRKATNEFLATHNTYTSGDAGGETSGDASQYERDLTSMTLTPEEYRQLQLEKGYSTTQPASLDFSPTRSTSRTVFNGYGQYMDDLHDRKMLEAHSMDSTLRYEPSDTDGSDSDESSSDDVARRVGGNLSPISYKKDYDGSGFSSDSDGDLEFSNFNDFTLDDKQPPKSSDDNFRLRFHV